jgi:hypothetical protein
MAGFSLDAMKKLGDLDFIEGHDVGLRNTLFKLNIKIKKWKRSHRPAAWGEQESEQRTLE